MKIGQLRHKVTIQRNAGNINDGGGNITPNWVDVATVWANVSPMSMEKTLALQSVQQVTHTVKTRYRADITPDKRFLFKGRVLDIKHVNNVDERNKELIVNCLEG